MKRILASFLLVAALLATPAFVFGQTRDEKVRNDRFQLEKDTSWYYDDLETAMDIAAEANKPMMVVLRCIP